MGWMQVLAKWTGDQSIPIHPSCIHYQAIDWTSIEPRSSLTFLTTCWNNFSYSALAKESLDARASRADCSILVDSSFTTMVRRVMAASTCLGSTPVLRRGGG